MPLACERLVDAPEAVDRQATSSSMSGGGG
jgi:hypothetical protein